MHVSGESLLNDGSAVVFFTIFGSLFLAELGIDGLGQDINLGQGIGLFLRMSMGGALIGIAFALGLMMLLFVLNRRLEREENVVQVAAVISVAYISFYVSEMVAGCSGVIAVVMCGITTQAFGGNMINSKHTMEAFVELVEWLLNTLLFALAGVAFGHIIADKTNNWGAKDWGYLVILWVLLNVIRFALVFVFYPLLSRIGLKSNMAEATFLSFGGLRGAVGIALALALEAEAYHATNLAGYGQEFIEWTTTLFGMVGGVAFFTLIINGSLSGPLLVKLGLAESSVVRKNIVKHFAQATKDHVLDAFVRLLADPRFQHLEFPVIMHYVPILGQMTLQDLRFAVERNMAKAPSGSKYKEPNLSKILPYLVEHSAGSHIAVDTEKGEAKMSSKRAPSTRIDFKGLTNLYQQLHPQNTAAKGDQEETNLLITAAANGHVDTLKGMLKHSSVDINVGDYDKRTALHLAAGEGHMDTILTLIQHGANVNAEDRWGGRPLDDAIRSNKSQAAALLRKYNAIPGSKTEQNADLITFAAAGDVDRVKEFLESDQAKKTDFDINAGDYDKRTALHLAAGEGHCDVVALLCDAGASLDVKDRWGNTCLDDAVRAGHEDTIEVLRKYGKRSLFHKTAPNLDLAGRGTRTMELRQIFIETLRQAYVHQVERGELDGRGLLDKVLFGSLDSAAVDNSQGKPLNDWEATNASTWNLLVTDGLHKMYTFQWTDKVNNDSEARQYARLRFQVRRTLAFLSAHTLAQQRFRIEFCKSEGNADEFTAAKQIVLEESEEEVAKAKAFLDSIDEADVASVVSHLACLILLNQHAGYVEYLASAGMLKPKEANHFLEEIDHEMDKLRHCSGKPSPQIVTA